MFVLMKESVARQVGKVQAGAAAGSGPRLWDAASTKLVEQIHQALAFFVACQRSKSAPSMKNLRPI